MINSINQIAEGWFDWQVSMLWQISLLVLIVWVVDKVVKRWAWPKLRYALWLLIFVKLIVPPGFSSPFSLTSNTPEIAGNLVRVDVKSETVDGGQTERLTAESQLPVSREPEYSAISEQQVRPVEVVPSTEPMRVEAAAVEFNRYSYLLGVWGVGMVFLAGCVLFRFRQISRQCLKNSSGKLPERFWVVLQESCKRVGLNWMPEVVLSRNVNCPAVFGFFRPVILLPANRLDKLSRAELEHILLHELSHIKRGDLIVHGFSVILQVGYWFNPVVWIAGRRMRNLRELCCDASVARILKEDTSKYRITLLETARSLLAEKVEWQMGLLGLFEDGNKMVERMKWLEKKTWRFGKLQTASVLVTLAVMIGCVLPMAKAEEQGSYDLELAQNQVMNFFANNFSDITSRETIEWGEPEKTEDGNISIRYKYTANILNRRDIIANQVFTFDRDGRFVSVTNVEGFPKDIEKAASGNQMPIENRLQNLPADWVVKGTYTASAEELDQFSKKFGAKIIKLTNTSLAYQGRPIQVNMIKTANPTAAQKVYYAILQAHGGYEPAVAMADETMVIEFRKMDDNDLIEKARKLEQFSNTRTLKWEGYSRKEHILQKTEEIFEMIRTADYEYFLQNRGKWQEFPLVKTYMPYKDYPHLVWWISETFKENPIDTVEIKMLWEKPAPVVYYKLNLQDGGFLEGDLRFEYGKLFNENGSWFPVQQNIYFGPKTDYDLHDLDWHEAKNPIRYEKKAQAENDIENRLQNLPSDWVVKGTYTASKSELGQFSEKLGGRVVRLTNTYLEYQGKGIQVNVIDAANEAERDKIYDAVLKMHGGFEPAVAKVGNAVVEFSRTDDNELVLRTRKVLGLEQDEKETETGVESEKDKAVEAAEDWLELVDEGKYGQSWDEAAGFFRRSVGRGQWVAMADSVRQPLGKLVSRELIGSTITTEVPGAPDGQYCIIQFKAEYENKKQAIETVTPMLDDGQWRVSGYFIQ